MKNATYWILGLALLLAYAGELYNPRMAAAAQSGNSLIEVNVASSLAGCAWPTGWPTTLNSMALCPINNSGQLSIALAVNGGAFATYSPQGGGSAVTSFNGRTGAVTLTDADVLGTGVKAATTVTASTTLQ